MHKYVAILIFLGLLPATVINAGSAHSHHLADNTVAEHCRSPLRTIHNHHPIDKKIIATQKQYIKSQHDAAEMEKLGWLFIEKARQQSDHDYFTEAFQAAHCLETTHHQQAAAHLLKAYLYLNTHRFNKAEQTAKQLLEKNQNPFAYMVLGDALMEQGRLDKAIAAYQSMIELKPGLQAYSRIAHIRWLTGDLKGAIAAMQLAANAGSQRQPEPKAWVLSRLSLYQLQTGAHKKALQNIHYALEIMPNYAPALYVHGQILMSRKKHPEAAGLLRRAVEIDATPAHQWALIEALDASGQHKESTQVKNMLNQFGALEDARTYALYLASNNEQLSTAVDLAQQELQSRQDVYTFDAIAWALASAGKLDQAFKYALQALEHNTKDARLLYHSGVIASRLGKKQHALKLLEESATIKHMLLPSEQQKLFIALKNIKKQTT